jgi:hypothetical protein
MSMICHGKFQYYSDTSVLSLHIIGELDSINFRIKKSKQQLFVLILIAIQIESQN